ncbi:MAG: MGMT family protein [Chlamydiota bacterium]
MEQKPLLKVPFAQGPHIGVHFLAEKEGFKVSLVESDEFYASFFTEIDKTLRNKLLTWIEEYGRGLPSAVDFLPRQKTSSFTDSVLKALRLIPFGEVVSYSELAALSDSERAVRAVGTICRLNRYPLFLPCHRVVRKGGSLGGFAFGSPLKTTLLQFEEEAVITR